MNYIAQFIEGITVEEIDAEYEQMLADEYRYGRSIDWPRVWDLNHTKKLLLEAAQH